MVHKNEPVVGVLSLCGTDGRGALALSLDYLDTRPKGLLPRAYERCDIDVAWARGIGPFGGAMVRFVTNVPTLGGLEDRRNLVELQQRLDVTAPGMKVLVRRASEQWDTDPGKTHMIFTRRGRTAERGEPEDSLRHLLAILAGHQLDIAEYDRILVGRSRFSEGWRIFDLQGRGGFWLDATFQEACRLAGPNRDGRLNPPPQPRVPSDFEDFARATLQTQEWPSPSSGERYLYFRVESPDHHGLFAAVDRFARTAPGHSGRVANRPVIRELARGVGGLAQLVVVTLGTTADAPLLEEGLRKVLGKAKRPQDRTGNPAQVYGWPAVAGEVRASVSSWDTPPTVLGHSDSQTPVTVVFEAKQNRPGILASVFRSASEVESAGALVYYLGGRLKRNYESDLPSHRQCAACAIGWVVERRGAREFQKRIDAIIRPLCSARKPPLWSPKPALA